MHRLSCRHIPGSWLTMTWEFTYPLPPKGRGYCWHGRAVETWSSPMAAGWSWWRLRRCSGDAVACLRTLRTACGRVPWTPKSFDPEPDAVVIWGCWDSLILDEALAKLKRDAKLLEGIMIIWNKYMGQWGTVDLRCAAEMRKGRINQNKPFKQSREREDAVESFRSIWKKFWSKQSLENFRMFVVCCLVDGCLCCLVDRTMGHVTMIKQQRDDVRRWGAGVEETEWMVFFSSVVDMARTTAHRF